MTTRTLLSLLAAAAIAGCMAGNTPAPDAAPSDAPQATAAVTRGGSDMPLILDKTDLRLGTTAQFARIPTAGELHDLTLLPGLAHVVLALDTWPEEFTPLEPLNSMPDEADLIVVMRGYPPRRSAAEMWNYLRGRVRFVLVVDGPPVSSDVINDLNSMRQLERVIAEMDEPSRSGFERLQRPMSFRKIVR